MRPQIASVIPFNGEQEDEVLRLAACLEEHYPHSMAKAVVAEAERRGLHHEERHSKVEYIVAHGVSSSVDGKKVVIGSHHFVFEDEGCVIPEGEEEKFDALPEEYSHLFLGVGGVLSAVICVKDPLREEAGEIIDGLPRRGRYSAARDIGAAAQRVDARDKSRKHDAASQGLTVEINIQQNPRSVIQRIAGFCCLYPELRERCSY